MWGGEQLKDNKMWGRGAHTSTQRLQDDKALKYIFKCIVNKYYLSPCI